MLIVDGSHAYVVFDEGMRPGLVYHFLCWYVAKFIKGGHRFTVRLFLLATAFFSKGLCVASLDDYTPSANRPS